MDMPHSVARRRAKWHLKCVRIGQCFYHVEVDVWWCPETLHPIHAKRGKSGFDLEWFAHIRS